MPVCWGSCPCPLHGKAILCAKAETAETNKQATPSNFIASTIHIPSPPPIVFIKILKTPNEGFLFVLTVMAAQLRPVLMQAPSFAPRCSSRALLLLLITMLLSGCKDPLALIPKADSEGRPPLIRPFNGSYAIIPRPLQLKQSVTLSASDLDKILGSTNSFYELRLYDKDGKKIGEVSNQKKCVTDKAWEVIDTAAKEDGGHPGFAGALGGVTCYNSNLSAADAAKFRGLIDQFLDTYAK